MKVAFRADASLLLGSGHVMRCLTLAEALRAEGSECLFICREHAGNMVAHIRQHGFAVAVLPMLVRSTLDTHHAGHACANSLGCDWQTDAQQTQAILRDLQPDWLVVDHYALDWQWEVAQQPHCQKLLVIDDLADRTHHCDVLLDQNLGRHTADYKNLVPAHSQVMAGPQYALLRPEFTALRAYSLQRRQQPQLKHLLITMGGADLPNATAQVLLTLQSCGLPPDCCITVVMGSQAPWLQQIQTLAQAMPWPTKVLVNVTEMAQRMADSDLAIGAAGGTAWERCCLGLPSIVVVLADNQCAGARALQQTQAAMLIGRLDDIALQLPLAIQAMTQANQLAQFSAAASAVADGRGVGRLVQALGVTVD